MAHKIYKTPKEIIETTAERGDNLAYIEEFDALCIDPRLDEIAKYPAKQHARSVARRLGIKEGLIYLEGRPTASIEDSDQPKTFRQRRYFFYLTGVDFEDCSVTYDIGKDDLRLFIPAVNPRTVIWLGATPSKAACEEKYDIDVVDYTTNLAAYVKSVLASKSSIKVFSIHADQAPPIKSRVDSLLLMPAMDAARSIKSDYEIALIRRANDISSYAHEGVLRGITWADNETQIEAMFAARCIARGAKKQAYGIIAASGVNASTLHYMANDEPLEGRQLVCLDAGCEWSCYASDVTRTFPISGTFSKEAQEVYDLVDQMQQECIAAVKPGANFWDIQMLAMSIAVKGLMKLGILHNGTYEEMFFTGAAFFPHGLGHHLGLEVHDVSAPPSQKLPAAMQLLCDKYGQLKKLSAFQTSVPPYYAIRTLEENMVITVEPGIYFSRYAIEQVYLKDAKYAKYINTEVLEKYYPVGGVRIEDNILVTKDGNEVLTAAPKGEKACEIIREAKKHRGKQALWEF